MITWIFFRHFRQKQPSLLRATLLMALLWSIKKSKNICEVRTSPQNTQSVKFKKCLEAQNTLSLKVAIRITSTLAAYIRNGQPRGPTKQVKCSLVNRSEQIERGVSNLKACPSSFLSQQVSTLLGYRKNDFFSHEEHRLLLEEQRYYKTRRIVRN